MTRALLVDVSNYQQAIGFGALAGATVMLEGVPVGVVEGVIAKATEGTNFTDPYFAMNWSGAKLAGLARGAYHFARPDQSGPKEEADRFLSVVGHVLEPGDVLALDVEDPPGSKNPTDLRGWVSTWLDYVAAWVGFRPMLYSTFPYLRSHNLTGDAGLAESGLWLASWYLRPPAGFPKPPPDWPFVALWQFTDHGEVAGISGPVDCNYFNGSIDQFKLYGKPAIAAVPDRAPLDAWYAAWQNARAAFGDPADLPEWDAMIPHLDAVKQRNGIP